MMAANCKMAVFAANTAEANVEKANDRALMAERALEEMSESFETKKKEAAAAVQELAAAKKKNEVLERSMISKEAAAAAAAQESAVTTAKAKAQEANDRALKAEESATDTNGGGSGGGGSGGGGAGAGKGKRKRSCTSRPPGVPEKDANAYYGWWMRMKMSNKGASEWPMDLREEAFTARKKPHEGNRVAQNRLDALVAARLHRVEA